MGTDRQFGKTILVIPFTIIAMLILFKLFFGFERLITSYTLSDWLINYSTGFIRRGLGGSLLLWLQTNWSINVDLVVTWGSVLVYSIITITYCYRIFQIRNSLDFHIICILLFLPASIMMPILVSGIIGRKEYLFVLLLLFHIYVINFFLLKLDEYDSKNLNPQNLVLKYFILMVFGYNFFLIPIVLTHEAWLFLSLPLNFILTFYFFFRTSSFVNCLVQTIVVYSPAILVSGYLLSGEYVQLPSKTDALEMCLPFNNLAKIDCHDNLKAFKYLSMTSTEAFAMTYGVNIKPTFNFLVWCFLGISNLLLALYAGTACYYTRICNQNIYREPNFTHSTAMMMTATFFLPLILSLPLYLFTVDWGRWTSHLILSFIICCLFCDKRLFLFQGIPTFGMELVQLFDNFKNTNLNKSNLLKIPIFIFMIYILSSTKLAICCKQSPEKVFKSLTDGNLDLMIESIRQLTL